MLKKIVGIFLMMLMVIQMTGCEKKEEAQPVVTNTPAVEEEVLPPITEMTMEEILSHMSIQKKAAQMVQAERGSITPTDAKAYGIGSVLSGGGSSPKTNTPEGWSEMYNGYQQSMMKSKLPIPILYGIDAVHGNNNVYGATIFPHNIGLGATRNPALVEAIGTAVAKEVAVTGIDWNFTPCVAVVQDIRWGRTYESFGESKEIQTLLVESYVKGLQSNNIIGTAKHFVGDGATTFNASNEGYKIDQGDTIISEAELKDIHLEGYRQAIKAGVDTVMVSFSSFNGEKMHANKALLTDVLRGELGFEGVVISDWEAIHQLPGDFYDQVVSSVNAGVDMLMEPTKWKETINTIVSAVNKGDITEARVDEAVLRILKLKEKHQLFSEPTISYTGEGFNTDEHKELARTAARESAVLLKNENNLLPLSKDTNVLLLGEAADNVALQCGGWTIGWQGVTEADAVPGVSIKTGLETIIKGGVGQIYTDISDADKADVVVVVIGEKPYAEGMGDNGDLSLDSETVLATTKTILSQAEKTGLPMVTLMVAGRPLLITEEIKQWDAFAMLWLPGSEGGLAVGDLLFGDYKFSGKLPVTWPGTKEDFGQNSNHSNENFAPLFKYGEGLVD